jgi:DNA-binding IclR family transcriptional regulator
VAALSLALPTARFDRERLPGWVGALSSAVAKVEAALSAR